MEMLFTGSPISAHDALLHGLISKVVSEDRLEEETLAIARRVCQASRPVVALGKATFYRYDSVFVTMEDVPSVIHFFYSKDKWLRVETQLMPLPLK